MVVEIEKEDEGDVPLPLYTTYSYNLIITPRNGQVLVSWMKLDATDTCAMRGIRKCGSQTVSPTARGKVGTGEGGRGVRGRREGHA